MKSVDLSAIFHEHNMQEDSFFVLIFEILKKPCLMTHIEHTFLEFEYTESSIFKNVGFHHHGTSLMFNDN